MTIQLDPQSLLGWLAGFSVVISASFGSAQAQPVSAGSSVQATTPYKASSGLSPALQSDQSGQLGQLPPSAGNCPLQPSYPLPSKVEDLQQLLLLLDTYAPVCLRIAEFHAWRGAALLALNQPGPAIESLERALLINPDFPGALLDYAAALLATGDARSARGLLLQLGSREDVSPGMRKLLDLELAATNPDVLRSRWFFSTAAGTDSNLNNAPSASELTLTFPQGALTLPLLDSSRPRRGAAAMAIAQWQGLKPQGSQLWLFQADVRSRYTSEAATRYRQADLAATWLQAPDAPQQWIARAGASQTTFGGQTLLQSARASFQRQWRGSTSSFSDTSCRPSAGVEWEGRQFPSSGNLNGKYVGLVAAAVCNFVSLENAETAGVMAQPVLNLQLRTGTDRASAPDRAGGNFKRTELRASLEKNLGTFKLNGEYGFSRQVDASGYSPLLADNLIRKINRHSLRAEVSRPLDLWPQVDWFVSAEINLQHSNLDAFRSRQNAYYAGMRWSKQ